MAYEGGVLYLGGTSPAGVRTGADSWMRSALRAVGTGDHWLLPLLLVVILLSWQVVSFRDWRFSPGILAGMVVESFVWAVALLGISRLIDVGFSYLEQGGPLCSRSTRPVDIPRSRRWSVTLERVSTRRPCFD